MKKLNSNGFSHHLLIALIVVATAIAGTYAVVASHADTPTCHTTVYSAADVHSQIVCVEHLQQLADYVPAVNPKLTVDGYYGPATATGIRQVEATDHLTVDSGIAGPQVWGALCSVGSKMAAGSVGYEAALNSGCTMPGAVKPVTPTPAPTMPPKTTTPVTVSTPTPVSTAAGCPTPAPQLQEGSTGNCVKMLQMLLGVSPVDGDFGPQTLAALKSFQSKLGLTVDGVVGPCTWGAVNINGGSTAGCPAHTSASQKATIEQAQQNWTKGVTTTSTTSTAKPVSSTSSTAPKAGTPANESQNNLNHQASPRPSVLSKFFHFVKHSIL